MMHWCLKDLQKRFNSDFQCPSSDMVTDELEYKKALYYGFEKSNSDEVVGELACYCKYLHDNEKEFKEVTFQDVNPKDDTKYCKAWKSYESIDFWLKFLVPVFIVIINAIITNFYCMLV